MAISRDQLYEQVWTDPMLAVAARYGVSSSYLARVCECLNVPRPPRGYWARIKHGQRPKKPALPPPRPGDETAWTPGISPGAYGLRRPRRAQEPSAEAPSDAPRRHALLVGLKEYYDAARLSDEGYLRPNKRLLPDLYVSKDTLPRALDVANELFLAFEKHGHRVMFALTHAHRPDLDQREKPSHPLWHTWRPSRPTVVVVERESFTLTLYEIAAPVEMRYVNGKYVPSDSVAMDRRYRHWERTWTTTRDMPSGRLALRACSADWRAKWEMHWRESKPGQLPSKFRTIRRDLRNAASIVRERILEANRQAELERQRWEEADRQRRRQERAERQAKALRNSRDQLLELVDQWARARRIEDFFADAEQRLANGTGEGQRELTERLARARQLLGGTDALRRFGSWKVPEELDPTAHQPDPDDG